MSRILILFFRVCEFFSALLFFPHALGVFSQVFLCVCRGEGGGICMFSGYPACGEQASRQIKARPCKMIWKSPPLASIRVPWKLPTRLRGSEGPPKWKAVCGGKELEGGGVKNRQPGWRHTGNILGREENSHNTLRSFFLLLSLSLSPCLRFPYSVETVSREYLHLCSISSVVSSIPLCWRVKVSSDISREGALQPGTSRGVNEHLHLSTWAPNWPTSKPVLEAWCELSKARTWLQICHLVLH